MVVSSIPAALSLSISSTYMAYMTCWDFGGWCKQTIYGETAEETIENMMAHLNANHTESEEWNPESQSEINRVEALIWKYFPNE